MKRYLRSLLPVLVLMSYAALNTGELQASIITIDFEKETSGPKSNNYSVVGASNVLFSDSNGQDLYVEDFGAQGSGGHSLYVGADMDLSMLEIALGFSADFISLDFGNDDPKYTNAGDLAVLTLFQGVTQVGQLSMLLNRDDLMNQTISFGSVGGSVLFDHITFAYTDPYFQLATGGGWVNIGCSEVVDNLVMNSVPQSVPEPAALLMAATGSLALILRRFLP